MYKAASRIFEGLDYIYKILKELFLIVVTNLQWTQMNKTQKGTLNYIVLLVDFWQCINVAMMTCVCVCVWGGVDWPCYDGAVCTQKWKSPVFKIQSY